MNGHLTANLDPLKIMSKNVHSELDYKTYGFQEKDLDKEIFIDGSLGIKSTKLNKIINILMKAYIEESKEEKAGYYSYKS